MPGPIEPIHVMGQEIDSMMVTPPLAFDLGMSIAVVTYNGSLRMTVLSDESVMANPEKLTAAFEEELNILATRIMKLD